MSDTAIAIAVDTREAYFALEEETGERHEFVDGVAYAMVGGTAAHNLITMNLSAALHAKTRSGPCQVFQQGMKLRLDLASGEQFYYPDVMVCCDPADDAKLWRERPVFLAEVLSPGTERLDKAEKLLRYQAILSLETYLVVHATRSECWLHSKARGWQREITDLIQPLRLVDFDLNLTFETLYQGVSF